MIEPRLLAILECPRDHSALRVEGGTLCCDRGHRYPVVDGIPVFLLAEKAATIDIAAASLAAAENGTGGPLYLETLGLADDERRGIEKDWGKSGKIDAAISYLIGATSGLAYVNLIGRLQDYPIPEIPIDRGNGGLLLDIGSNWGRWSLAAARKGWSVIGIDPSLGALMAARRAFSASGPKLPAFVCGDALSAVQARDVWRCILIFRAPALFRNGRRSDHRGSRQSACARRFRQNSDGTCGRLALALYARAR